MTDTETRNQQPNTRLLRILGAIMLSLAVLSTLQLLGITYLEGMRSEAFALRLWATCFMWLGNASAVLVIVPFFGTSARRVLRARVGGVFVMLLALAGLVWLWVEGRLEGVLLVTGIGIAFVGLSGSFWTSWLRRRVPSQSRA